MGLLEDLQNVGKNLPPSHIPAISDVQGILGAVVAFLEKGQVVIEAAANGDPASAATPDELHQALAPVEQAAAETVLKAEQAVDEVIGAAVAGPAVQTVEAVPVVTAAPAGPELTPEEVQQLQALVAKAQAATPATVSEVPA